MELEKLVDADVPIIVHVDTSSLEATRNRFRPSMRHRVQYTINPRSVTCRGQQNSKKHLHLRPNVSVTQATQGVGQHSAREGSRTKALMRGGTFPEPEVERGACWEFIPRSENDAET